MATFRNSVNKFSRGNHPMTGMGIGVQEEAEKWLKEHKIPVSLKDMEPVEDEYGHKTIEIVVEKNLLGTEEGRGEVKIVFTF